MENSMIDPPDYDDFDGYDRAALDAEDAYEAYMAQQEAARFAADAQEAQARLWAGEHVMDEPPMPVINVVLTPRKRKVA